MCGERDAPAVLSVKVAPTLSINGRGAALAASRGLRWCLVILITWVYSASGTAASSRIPLVVVSEARTASVIKEVPLTGTVTSPKVARLSARVSGQVETLRVEVGDYVEAGDVLLKIDSELEELMLRASQAATQQARAELNDAKRRYANAEMLRKQASISANEIDLLQAEVEIDAAALKRQLAEERRYQARVKRHTVKAPFAGVVSERLTEVGEWIEPGTPILTLVAIADLRVEFRVPQEFYVRINDRSRVSVTLDAFPDRQFEGKIDAVVPVSDPKARTFLMRVLLEHSDVKITPGMSVHGTLHLGTGRQGIVISRDALLRYPDGRVTVWVVRTTDEESKVSERLVKTGESFDGQISILDGLEPGVLIVVRGNESLQEGQVVRMQTAD